MGSIQIQQHLPSNSIMNTQIIKLEAWKTSIKESLRRLGHKTYSKKAEVTVIIKETNAIHPEPNTEPRETAKVIPSQPEKESESGSSDESLEIRISNTDILPNVLISSHKKADQRARRASLDVKMASAMKIEGSSRRIESGDAGRKVTPEKAEKEKTDRDRARTERERISELKNTPSFQDKMRAAEGEQDEVFNPFSMLGSPTSQIVKLEKPQENQNGDEDSVEEFSMTDDESAPESLFVVENKLNDALTFINRNRLFELEEFLYDFKTRYNNMSERVQIKWRLLMAYCKENRKEYERASILYTQVLELAEQSPKSLLIDKADIDHRLGICFMEIQRWNDGISAFISALNDLKSKGRVIKYAECINNLGTLYLSAGQIDQAEKCFLISYDIKKKNYPPHSRKLISSLLNLFECNITTHNYEQAQELLNIVESIVLTLPNNEMIKGGLLRRKGKLAFLKGNLTASKEYFHAGIKLLEEKFPYCLDYGELMNNFAMLRLDEGELVQAKELFNKALIILNFYFTKDSSYIQAIKKNLELATRLLQAQQLT